MTMTAPKKKAKSAEPLKLDSVTADELITETVLPVDESDDPAIPVVAAKPGEPGFSWADEYPDEKVFTYTAEDGRTVGLAAMGDKRRPKPGVLRKLRHQPPIEQMWFVLERVASKAALEVSDDFDDSDYSKMFEQWSEWSNTTAGESSRSSAS